MENFMINPRNELMAGPKTNVPRDVFLHLFMMVTLYWSAISFITLCWQYINYFSPDNLSNYYRYMDFGGSIRFAIASLVIVFPLFILTSWLLNNIYAKEALVRDSKMRKWLIYLTLFVASLVIIGDLIYVINTFLGGELTTRFILKALSVLAVAAVIFWYYLQDVRGAISPALAKYTAIGASAAVLLLFFGSFFIIGSPMKARSAQFDIQRTNDLQNIQWQVVNYWQRKGTLPNALTDLNDSISGYVAPKDPQTQMSYEYNVKDGENLNFELCATFNLDSQLSNPKTPSAPAMYPNDISQNWTHPAGHFCFNRTIDQQLYPPLDKGK